MCLYESSSAVCPFYKEEIDNRRKIVCEGITSNSLLHVCFQTRPSADKYKTKYCYSYNYKKCKVCSLLESKHEEA